MFREIKDKYYQLNDYVGDKLSNGLSSMEMFYIITFLVLAPLLVQRPDTLITWVQYVSTAILQASALPLLGYTTKKSGEKQERLLQETHNMVMQEMGTLKEIVKEIHECATKHRYFH